MKGEEAWSNQRWRCFRQIGLVFFQAAEEFLNSGLDGQFVQGVAGGGSWDPRVINMKIL
jgi:hypothetical protein